MGRRPEKCWCWRRSQVRTGYSVDAHSFVASLACMEILPLESADKQTHLVLSSPPPFCRCREKQSQPLRRETSPAAHPPEDGRT